MLGARTPTGTSSGDAPVKFKPGDIPGFIRRPPRAESFGNLVKRDPHLVSAQLLTVHQDASLRSAGNQFAPAGKRLHHDFRVDLQFEGGDEKAAIPVNVFHSDLRRRSCREAPRDLQQGD